MFITDSPFETQTPAHWNLIDHSTTAPPPVLSPSSIFLSPFSRFAVIPASKNSALFL
jgi:hypothetical protein